MKFVIVVVLIARSSPALCHSMACSLPGSSVHGISQQEYWSGLPLPSPGDLTQGSNLRLQYLLHWQVDSLPLSHPGSLQWRLLLLLLSH